LENDLKREFMRVMMQFRKAGMPTPPGEDIRMGELFVLSKIPEEGASLTEIQDNLFMTKSAVSQMLASLEKRRLVRRDVDRTDRRRIAVTLTEEGRRFRHRQRRYADQIMDMTIAQFGADNMKELIRLLKVLAEVSATIRQEVEGQNFLNDSEGDKPVD